MGLLGAEQFTPRATTYVFVNVVVAPRYVARVQPGSGGLLPHRRRAAPPCVAMDEQPSPRTFTPKHQRS